MPAAHTVHQHTPVYEHATSSSNGSVTPAPADWRDPRYQAFALLRLAFTVAPIAFGLDKFFNVLVHWPNYLAPWINDIAPGTGQQFMYFVGGTEILAGLIVALKPRYGAYVVAAWLGGIVINLLSYSGFYDIALRDFGLMLAALTLGRLASVYDRPLRLRRH
jgi:DoxX